MIDLLRSEWIKFRSVRSTVVVLALAGVLVVAVALIAALNSGQGTTNLTSLTVGVSLGVLLFGALGVQVVGQEHRFSTIRATFSARPDRTAVMVAKLLVVMLSSALVAVTMLAVCWVIGTAFTENFVLDGLDRRAALGIVLFSMGWSAIGVGVGAIVRQPTAGILVLLGWAFVLESILGGIVAAARPWLPFANGFQMTLRDESGSSDLRGVLEGGVYFFVVVAVIVAVGIVATNRRDA